MSLASTRSTSDVQWRDRDGVTASGAVDISRLLTELRHNVQGEVRFDSGSRALYSRDASNYRQVPIGVVVPRSTDDVVNTVRSCHRYGVPLLARGGGTSLAGQCCNVAVVMDFSKYLNNIIDIDPERRLARVQPGTVLDHLRKKCAPHQLTFGPDPATHNHCTLGGMVGNNSCGIHSVMSGRTADNVRSLDILTYDGLRMTVGETTDEELQQIISSGGRKGEIYRRLRDLRDRYADHIREKFPDIPRRVSGYNLDELLPENNFNVARALVGTECTCALVLEAELELIHNPPYRVLTVIGYPDIYTAADHITEIMEHGPVGLEGLDHHLIRYNHLKGMNSTATDFLPEGSGWLLVEFGGESREEADHKAHKMKDALQNASDSPHVVIFDDREQESLIWEIRESGLGATAYVPGQHDTWPGWEDAAVDPQRLGGYLRDFRALLEKHGYACSLYGHFGQGCVHTRIDFELKTPEGIANYRGFAEEAANLVVAHGGSLSGEHGDGQSRAELLPKMFGDELVEAFREFKSIWDPDWRMNPGKVVDPYRLDQNLALGPNYHPLRGETHFGYPDDSGDFAHATVRCVGIGKCRRTEGGTMCPSYMVTREEKHSTRGRARLLYEMLEGDVITDYWRSNEVKDALDLCLACKGCKSDCPVNVDMATYKAEFLSHYYNSHWRPRSAYSMGWIYWWARLASFAPALVNWASRARGLQAVVKWFGDIAPQRELPRFAPETFTAWYRRRGSRIRGYPEVILWPDTFNNHFHPEVAKAALQVLEDVGFDVMLPQATLCCGRPLYDYGMLHQAKQQLSQIMDVLRPSIRRGVCLVGLEPSCVAVFRDELVNLFPHDEDAQRLSQQTYLLSEFLTQRVEDYQPPRLERKARIHVHCHQHALMGSADQQEILDRMGVDYDVIDSGCCGMAGSFGFEADHYDVSVACGERVLLPAVRETDADTILIADGFSCQEQIQQLTNRRALHLAQVLEMARRDGPQGPRRGLPEVEQPYADASLPRRAIPAYAPSAAFAAGLVLAVAAVSWASGRDR